MKYFIESLPKNCEYCDCCHTKPYDNRYKIDGEKFCGILNEDVEVYYYHGDGRPEFCPLREIPKEIKAYDNNSYEERCYIEGWNGYLYEIYRRYEK